MNPLAKYAGFTLAVLLVLLASAFSGWTVRGWRCDTAMAEYQQAREVEAEQQRNASQQIEAKQLATTEQSTQRLDQQQAAQQKETVYVEKKVVQYRDRWRNRDCRLTDDWLQLYNESLFGSDPAVPEAGAAGSAPAGAGVLLPAGRD